MLKFELGGGCRSSLIDAPATASPDLHVPTSSPPSYRLPATYASALPA
ncbi:hypothetical protein K9N68_06340 [Kovacikia minuta CCNUW1]|nr:hypothetical protein [Kovacikia minuta]UBF27547.1 hypothetical protein K9N68_06340 [Kovacikia minuta CCNUW1]